MLNLVSGYETVAKMDLPWPSISTDRREMESKDECNRRRTRVLCCFQGLLLVSLGRKYCNTLVLGDPLLNKWIKLPRPGWPGGFDRAGFLALAAFCPDTRTLMVCSGGAGWTATLDLASARLQWTLDPYGRGPGAVGSPQSHACCLDGVFYCSFVTFPFERDGAERITLHDERACAIACYDPAGARQWQIVKEVWVAPETFDPIFLAQTSHGKLFVYMTPATADDEGFYHLFEATRVQGSNELEIVPSPLMDDEQVGSRIRLREDAEEEDEDEAALQRQMYLVPCFHGGGDDMLFWEGFDAFNRDKIKVLSLKDKLVREVKCSRENSGYPCQKCYYTAAPGTGEVLASLALKLEESK